ncbi:MAG: ATP-dependent RecD-like DNA helicase [Clostridia bacterium]|nr:ATP-dependent RecD-like DNA helicase [Clostridia bacterium]
MEFEKNEELRGLQKLEGTVERVIYANEENGYTICDMAVADDEIITAVGIMPLVGSGDRMCMYGKWIHNAKYGRQFSVEQYEKVMPADIASILRYLASRAIKGIGPKTAQKIVDEFGEDSFDVIENHPDWFANSIKGMSLKMAEAASESFKEQAGIRSAMLFFRSYFGAATTVKIYKKWGNAAVDMAKRNPYRLCNEIEGIGFERADSMAHSLGIERDNFDRIMSGIVYVLNQSGIQNGHICLPREKLTGSASALLEAEPERISVAIDELLRNGRLKELNGDGSESFIYLRENFEDEKYIAEKLKAIDKYCPTLDMSDIDRFIENEEMLSDIKYAGLQKEAIVSALRYGVMVLTGGPGTGKTTVVKALIHIFDSMGFKIALAAPTGRASKKLSEATSMEAKTIHRLLEMQYDTAGNAVFMRNELEALDEQVIIVDEASMIDNSLMAALLKAIKIGARFIIIGDSDQLPSVGAGNVLHDIIKSEKYATVRLTEIFRQSRESLIITNAHAVNKGIMPEISVKDNDFFFLGRTTDEEISKTIRELCLTRLPKTYGDMAVNGTQVLTPSRKGEAGTENLNVLLQAALNPPSKDKKEYRFRDKVFREGDKVMQTRNNYDVCWTRVYDGKEGCGIFNGDIGIIEEIVPHENAMVIIFDDRRVVYDHSILDDLEHAYAITVHKSQGSEYPIVVIPMCSAPHMLLTRNLLYTAITRAQSMVILVGRKDIISEMINNDRQSMRYTGLCEQITGIEQK